MSYKESRHLALQKNLHLADEFKFFNFSAILASIPSSGSPLKAFYPLNILIYALKAKV